MMDRDESFAKTTLPSPSVNLSSRVHLTEAIANVHYTKPYKIGGKFLLALIKILFYPLSSLRQGGGTLLSFWRLKTPMFLICAFLVVPLLTEGGLT